MRGETGREGVDVECFDEISGDRADAEERGLRVSRHVDAVDAVDADAYNQAPVGEDDEGEAFPADLPPHGSEASPLRFGLE